MLLLFQLLERKERSLVQNEALLGSSCWSFGGKASSSSSSSSNSLLRKSCVRGEMIGPWKLEKVSFQPDKQKFKLLFTDEFFVPWNLLGLLIIFLFDTS